MIDLHDEELIPLRDVPKFLPSRPSGKRLHISAVYRWAQRGLRGQRLETIKIGGTCYTSKEALQRFGSNSAGTSETSTGIATSHARRRQIDRALKSVEAILGNSVRKRAKNTFCDKS